MPRAMDGGLFCWESDSTGWELSFCTKRYDRYVGPVRGSHVLSKWRANTTAGSMRARSLGGRVADGHGGAHDNNWHS